jgi:hypothetical protein
MSQQTTWGQGQKPQPMSLSSLSLIWSWLQLVDAAGGSRALAASLRNASCILNRSKSSDAPGT